MNFVICCGIARPRRSAIASHRMEHKNNIGKGILLCIFLDCCQTVEAGRQSRRLSAKACQSHVRSSEMPPEQIAETAPASDIDLSAEDIEQIEQLISERNEKINA